MRRTRDGMRAVGSCALIHEISDHASTSDLDHTSRMAAIDRPMHDGVSYSTLRPQARAASWSVWTQAEFQAATAQPFAAVPSRRGVTIAI